MTNEDVNFVVDSLTRMEDVIFDVEGDDQPATKHASAEDVHKGKCMFIGNLSYSVTEDSLKEFFSVCGEIKDTVVMSEPGGRSKGCGLVTFATEEAAAKAVDTLNETELQGRKIFIREDLHQSGASGQSRYAPRGSPVSPRPGDRYGGDRDRGGYDGRDEYYYYSGGGGRSRSPSYDSYRNDGRRTPDRGGYDRYDRRRPRSPDYDRYGRGGGGYDRYDRPPPRDYSPAYRRESERRPQRPSGPPPDSQLFVGNLAWRVRWQELKDHFNKIGRVRNAEVMEERETGRSRGYGTVLFDSRADAERAIQEYHDQEFEGRRLIVRFDGDWRA